MSSTEIIALLAMTGWAIYKQTQISEVREHGRFKMAVIYGIVAVCVGGFVRPEGALAWTLLGASIGLSVVVGLARGRLTHVWLNDAGQAMRQGSTLTVALFLGMILAKFGIGTFAYLDHVQDGAGFGEIMAMIAIMVAVQAEIVWQRARVITAATQQSEYVSTPSR